MSLTARIATVLAVIIAAPIALTTQVHATGLVCDSTADYYLGREDYADAIAAHQRMLAVKPGDALAHYHLGFAYGMTGHRQAELSEYRKAAALGLRQWDFELNFGRAELESDDPAAAADSFKQAIALAPHRPEGYFNLGLAEERRRMFPQALEALTASLALDPNQPDARNMLGVIYAEQGDFARARQVWTKLVRTSPDFAPARENLTVLDERTAPPKVPADHDRLRFRTAMAGDVR